MKYLGLIWSFIYDHWLAFLSVSGVSIVTWIKNKVPEIANIQVPLWIVLLGLFVCLMMWYLYDIFLSDSKEIAPNKYEKPVNVIQEYKPYLHMSVLWKAWIGNSSNFSDRKIWVDGPFCPECMYELDRYEKSWFCAHCNKKYKIQSHIREYTLEKIIKIFTVKAEKVGVLEPKVFTTTQKGVTG